MILVSVLFLTGHATPDKQFRTILLGFNHMVHCDPQKSPDTPGSPEGNNEGPGTASSEPLLPS